MSRVGAHFIASRWIAGSGEIFASADPATGETVWEGAAAARGEIDQALAAAAGALEGWSGSPANARIGYLEAFGGQLGRRREEISQAICRETGKPLWEARAEVGSMIGKISVSIEAYNDRCRPTVNELSGTRTATRFRAQGVVAVISPFNLPGYVPNSHIIPALLAGNTVVWKPSEKAPLVAEKLAELWENAALPPGVLNMLQGGAATGAALARHSALNALFVTGTYATGCAVHRSLAGSPEKILTLQMGGNNPLVVVEPADPELAAHYTILSAFLTAGQRCTCARRLVVPEGAEGDRFLDHLERAMATIRIAAYREVPEPFMGPVITSEAARSVLGAQEELERRGAAVLVKVTARPGPGFFLTPGLVDVTRMRVRRDAELFGPLLQLVRVPDFDAAIREANATAFGLSAGLLCEDAERYRTFCRRVRAGLINWNRQLTGASAYLPLGGVGRSGNHRPSGYLAADQCTYPVGSIEHDELLPPRRPPGLG